MRWYTDCFHYISLVQFCLGICFAKLKCQTKFDVIAFASDILEPKVQHTATLFFWRRQHNLWMQRLLSSRSWRLQSASAVRERVVIQLCCCLMQTAQLSNLQNKDWLLKMNCLLGWRIVDSLCTFKCIIFNLWKCIKCFQVKWLESKWSHRSLMSKSKLSQNKSSLICQIESKSQQICYSSLSSVQVMWLESTLVQYKDRLVLSNYIFCNVFTNMR